MANTISISSEMDAFRLLDLILVQQGHDAWTHHKLQFVSWPVLRVSYAGASYNGTLRSSQFRALVKLQETLYYQYALIVAKKRDSLSVQERERLELTTTIEKGSTLLATDLSSVLTFISSIAQADASHVAAIATVATTLGGYLMLEMRHRHRLEIMKVHHQQEKELKESDHQHKMNMKMLEHEYRMLEKQLDVPPDPKRGLDYDESLQIGVYREIISSEGLVHDVAKSSFEAIETLAASGKDADYVEINGVSGDQLQTEKLRDAPRPETVFQVGEKTSIQCTVAEITDGKGKDRRASKFACKFRDVITTTTFVWRPKTEEECPEPLKRQIHNQYHLGKSMTIVAVILKVFQHSFEIGLVEIFGRKPRSFKNAAK